MNRIIFLIVFLLVSISYAQIVIKEAFPNLSFSNIIDIQSANDGTNRMFVVSQQGYIYAFENRADVINYKTVLDISSTISSGGERGLLGLAFHPNYKENGFIYVDYTKGNPLRTVISRFYADPQPSEKVDIASELVLMEVEQPYSNHNGGQISFGSDGYLYISFGDGGSADDPNSNGQNRSTLLGSIIRIDVDSTDENKAYRIPSDNPFVGDSSDFRKEIFAYGLRNTWRFSFDYVTGELWAADVGQGKWEEINIVKNGGNYGWRTMEGFDCFSSSEGCDQTGLELPIWQYGHSSDGGYSITGGFVYHGNNAYELQNKYIYGDFVTGNIWMLQMKNNIPENELLSKTEYQISTFGVDENNELYFADYNSGKIYTFEGTKVTVLKENDNVNFSLNQNYPNPFNPSTTIKYSISNVRAENFLSVRLILYDILGREVSELVNAEQSPGEYEVIFDANNLTSGIYFARLMAGSYSKTISMQLLK